ncbi:carbohydrate ABC transporter permease [Paenibacillus fonticola]|uniref:carbohydrate ABC transporter permease n=1 Tax=Paenibacillus fonticola TaxID=379896 RepID=UPI000361BDC4|nr:carbohydrate ABC transporter permease [Paenibacillus fonticola]
MELQKATARTKRAWLGNGGHRLRSKVQNALWSLFRYGIISGICFVIIYPIIRKIAVAIMDKQDIYNPTIFLIPQNFTLDNIRTAMKVLNYFPTLGNTLVFVTITMLFTTLSCALAGYGFARFHFPGKNILFGLAILTILIPANTLMVPMYLHFRSFDFLGIIHLLTGKEGMNLINTYWPTTISALTANGLKAGLFIYIFRQFFRGLPKEIEESALIDGAGGFKTFFRIMLPNAVPPLITVLLFSFVWQYNDSFYTSLYMSEMNLMPTMVASIAANANTVIQSMLPGGYDPNVKIDPNYIAMIVDTGILLVIVPLLVLYLFVQRYFVESVERSGIVG